MTSIGRYYLYLHVDFTHALQFSCAANAMVARENRMGREGGGDGDGGGSYY